MEYLSTNHSFLVNHTSSCRIADQSQVELPQAALLVPSLNPIDSLQHNNESTIYNCSLSQVVYDKSMEIISTTSCDFLDKNERTNELHIHHYYYPIEKEPQPRLETQQGKSYLEIKMLVRLVRRIVDSTSAFFFKKQATSVKETEEIRLEDRSSENLEHREVSHSSRLNQTDRVQKVALLLFGFILGVGTTGILVGSRAVLQTVTTIGVVMAIVTNLRGFLREISHLIDLVKRVIEIIKNTINSIQEAWSEYDLEPNLSEPLA